eukprot:366410-Chlamydomonas_euryale.AAC.7
MFGGGTCLRPFYRCADLAAVLPVCVLQVTNIFRLVPRLVDPALFIRPPTPTPTICPLPNRCGVSCGAI